MAGLHYLTVQDMLWLHREVTKQVQRFDYARLEEATYYQYGYGGSLNLLGQAARFLTGFRKMRPFDEGNDACCLLGTLAFLRMNGAEVELDDAEAAQWVREVWANPAVAESSLSQKVKMVDGAHHGPEIPSARDILDDLMAEYPATLDALATAEAPVPLA